MSACPAHDRDGEQSQDGDLGQHTEQGLERGLEAALDEPEARRPSGRARTRPRPTGHSGRRTIAGAPNTSRTTTTKDPNLGRGI
jgi:hypothetical protein